MENVENQKYLEVYLKSERVGLLFSDRAALSFVYDKNYLQKPDAVKLSVSMPLREESFDHAVASAYFSGLLPDQNVRERLARRLHISQANTFALLKEIGGECAGAVSLYSPGRRLESIKGGDYRVLSDKEADDILSSLDKRPLLAGEEGVRICGAGAQNKLMIAFEKEKVAIPLYDTPSTHIIKPEITGFEASVHNEFFCMTLAGKIGLPVPQVRIYWLYEKPYYVIKRYDRQSDGEGIARLHQEDFCQALRVPPEMKYENEGGPTLEQCFSLLDDRIRSGAMAGNQKLILFQGVVFNFLVGNGDAHGKNFSILYDGEAESLAPFYDLMCSEIYEGDPLKAKMAMKLGGRYKFKNVSMERFLRLGESIGFKPEFVRRQVKTIADKVMKTAPVIVEELSKDSQNCSSMYEKINDVIVRHYQQIC